jgi:hypothetical protein
MFRWQMLLRQMFPRQMFLWQMLRQQMLLRMPPAPMSMFRKRARMAKPV